MSRCRHDPYNIVAEYSVRLLMYTVWCEGCGHSVSRLKGHFDELPKWAKKGAELIRQRGDYGRVKVTNAGREVESGTIGDGPEKAKARRAQDRAAVHGVRTQGMRGKKQRKASKQ